MTSCDSLETLLSGYIDGELTPEDHQRVKKHLEECHSCALKVIAMNEMKTQMSHVQFRDPPPEEWDEHAKGMFETAGRGLGFSFYIVAGLMYLVILVNVLWKALVVGECDWRLALLLAGLLGGTILLFVTVFTQRLKARRTDPYKDLVR
ncbi:MAG: zf-HC2 domain-containing protein [bacterium]